jgi:hypothetical protein
MPDDSAQTLNDRLARLECDLEHLTAGVGLLGIKPCSWCKRFLRASDPAALFDHGSPVCYRCIPEWWPHQCGQLSVKEREIAEHELKIWLVSYHHADVVKNPDKLPKDPQLQIVVSCYECHAAGYLAGVRCRFCDGRGTVWIVVPEKQS